MTLQSEISRDYGLCGACRHAWEYREAEKERETRERRNPIEPAPADPQP